MTARTDRPMFDPALPIDGAARRLSPDEALGVRVRALLETRPGQLPWSPEYGCDLLGLVGRPASPQTVAEARWRITDALQRWMPDVAVRAVRVDVARLEEGAITRVGDVPIAEASLMGLGSLAALTVDIELETPWGARSVRTSLTP